MVSFIYCICDCRYTVGIADHSYKRCTVTERIRKCASGTLTECTDYRSSRNQDLLLIFLFRRELRQDGLRDRDIRYVQLHIFQSLLKEADDAVHWHPVQVLFSFLQDEPVFPPDRDESHIHILQDRRQKTTT